MDGWTVPGLCLPQTPPPLLLPPTPASYLLPSGPAIVFLGWWKEGGEASSSVDQQFFPMNFSTKALGRFPPPPPKKIIGILLLPGIRNSFAAISTWPIFLSPLPLQSLYRFLPTTGSAGEEEKVLVFSLPFNLVHLVTFLTWPREKEERREDETHLPTTTLPSKQRRKKKKHVLSFPQIKLPPRKKKVLTAISACGENFDFFFHNPCQFPVCHTCHNACGEVLLLLLLSLLIPLFFLKSPPLSTGWCTSQVRSKRSCFNVDKWYCSLLFFSPPLFYLACCTTECGWVSPGGGKRRGSCYFMHPYIHRQTL